MVVIDHVVKIAPSKVTVTAPKVEQQPKDEAKRSRKAAKEE